MAEESINILPSVQRMETDDCDTEIPSAMTASYSEISYDSQFGGGGNQHQRQQSTSIESHNQQQSQQHPERPASLGYGRQKPSFPYNLEGTVSIDGNVTNYVTENLEYKIKLASPNTAKFDYSIPNSRTSTPSTSALGMSRQFMQHQQSTITGGPTNIYQFLDTNVLNDVEIEAQYLAASVDNLTENLCNLLHSISSITADNVETYKNAVNKLTDCMDGNIKNMYTIMAKTEEISNAMKPSEQIAVRIREIKGLVDMLDNVI